MHTGGPQAEADNEIRGGGADDAVLHERVLGYERPLRKPGLGEPHVREMTSTCLPWRCTSGFYRQMRDDKAVVTA